MDPNLRTADVAKEKPGVILFLLCPINPSLLLSSFSFNKKSPGL